MDGVNVWASPGFGSLGNFRTLDGSTVQLVHVLQLLTDALLFVGCTACENFCSFLL